MKGKMKNLMLAFAAILLTVACQQNEVIEETVSEKNMLKSGHMGDWTMMTNPDWAYTTKDVIYDVCEEGKTWPFFESANVTISNDEDCIYVKVVVEEGLKIHRLSFNAWPVGSPDINYDYDSFPYQMWFEGEDMSNIVVFKVCDQWDTTECLVFNVKVYTVKENGDYDQYWWVTADNIKDYSKNNVYLEYCWKDCECYPYRTQTPGGWGAPAKGNNPGMYRDMNFASVFENGLVLGGDGGYTLTLSSAAAVEAFLPSGGKPLPLGMNYTDPTSEDLGNAFAGHMVALALSLGFDAADPNFAMANGYLGDLVIMDGHFAGETVQTVFNLANDVLGGEQSDYLEELHTTISRINEYFVDGEWSGDGLLFEDCYDYEEE